MNLTEIKVRYDGNKCSKCGRDVKKGWTGYFANDNGNKLLFCQPCGEAIKKGEIAEKTEVNPEELNLVARLDQITFLLGNLVNDVKKLFENQIHIAHLVVQVDRIAKILDESKQLQMPESKPTSAPKQATKKPVKKSK